MEDIHDPTDFKNTSLQQLDLNLRCTICKDLYTTPMQLTTCIHSFCALCIRRRLAQERICPSCNAPADESKLIRNSVLDECANTWRLAARQVAIALEQGQAGVNNSVEPSPPPQQQQQQQESLPLRSQGRVATPLAAAPISSPAASRRSARIGNQQQPRYKEPIILDDDDFQQQQQPQPAAEAPTAAPPTQPQPQQSPPPAPQTSSPTTVNITTVAAATAPTHDRITQDSEVQCPICSQFMKQAHINEHLDRCMRGDSTIPQASRQFLRQPASSSSSPASSSPVTAVTPPTPTATSPVSSRRDQRQNTNRYGKKPIKLVYDMQKDRDLRKVLRDLGLPDHGDKQQLVWRHKEYVTLYYANLDAEHPKEPRALIQQLNEAELGYNQVRNSAHSPQLNIEEHNRKYKDQFAELIASARKRVRVSSSSSATSSSQDADPNNAINTTTSTTEPLPSSSSLPSTAKENKQMK